MISRRVADYSGRTIIACINKIGHANATDPYRCVGAASGAKLRTSCTGTTKQTPGLVFEATHHYRRSAEGAAAPRRRHAFTGLRDHQSIPDRARRPLKKKPEAGSHRRGGQSPAWRMQQRAITESGRAMFPNMPPVVRLRIPGRLKKHAANAEAEITRHRPRASPGCHDEVDDGDAANGPTSGQQRSPARSRVIIVAPQPGVG